VCTSAEWRVLRASQPCLGAHLFCTVCAMCHQRCECCMPWLRLRALLCCLWPGPCLTSHFHCTPAVDHAACSGFAPCQQNLALGPPEGCVNAVPSAASLQQLHLNPPAHWPSAFAPVCEPLGFSSAPTALSMQTCAVLCCAVPCYAVAANLWLG